jgi:beta-alanine degradation protein BauB
MFWCAPANAPEPLHHPVPQVTDNQPRAIAASIPGMSLDPAVTNPDHYKVVYENDRVRVLEYRDQPGESTTPHDHPDSVMYTLSAFRRRLVSGDVQREVELAAGTVGWLPAQQHHGENIGETSTHVIFVELKGSGASGIGATSAIGPESS